MRGASIAAERVAGIVMMTAKGDLDAEAGTATRGGTETEVGINTAVIEIANGGIGQGEAAAGVARGEIGDREMMIDITQATVGIPIQSDSNHAAEVRPGNQLITNKAGNRRDQ